MAGFAMLQCNHEYTYDTTITCKAIKVMHIADTSFCNPCRAKDTSTRYMFPRFNFPTPYTSFPIVAPINHRMKNVQHQHYTLTASKQRKNMVLCFKSVGNWCMHQTL